MEEQWLPSKEFGKYEVSDQGRIRNSDTGRVPKTYITKNGYEQVSIRSEGKKYTKKVHRLVADTFLECSDEKLDVIHKDNNRLRNCADNLEYRTRAETIGRAYSDGREQTHRMKKVRVVETGDIYRSVSECSKAMGLSKSTVSKCLNSSFLHTRDGYHFEAVE